MTRIGRFVSKRRTAEHGKAEQEGQGAAAAVTLAIVRFPG
jgi:hypothetical protein